MNEVIYVKWVEVPVRVYCDVQLEEKMTWHYPGCPATVGIERIEVCLYEDESKKATSLDQLKDSILEKLETTLEEEAWEHLD